MLNANTLFNTCGVFAVTQALVPADGIGVDGAVDDCIVSTAPRLDF